MAITTEMILTLIGIATPLFGAALWLAKQLDKKVKDGLVKIELEVKAQADERKRLLEERGVLDKRINDRIGELEKNSVHKDDYLQDRESTNRAIDGIALALRETSATITGRIDLVLFEVGRRNGHAKSDD